MEFEGFSQVGRNSDSKHKNHWSLPFGSPLCFLLFSSSSDTHTHNHVHNHTHNKQPSNIKIRPLRIKIYLTLHIYSYHLFNYQFTLTNYDPEPQRPIGDDNDYPFFFLSGTLMPLLYLNYFSDFLFVFPLLQSVSFWQSDAPSKSFSFLFFSGI